jgi:hypothetical protein
MIKFFRKLRYRSLESILSSAEGRKRLPKYLLYATGEIILVVIGILIALSINTWNENRKSVNVQNSILREIENGLDKDVVDMNHNINGHQQGLQASAYFNKIINNRPVDMDSVAYQYTKLLRGFASLQNTSSYESLKSRGLEIIQNDSLRLQIISLYEEDYATLKVLEERYPENQHYDHFFDQINTIIVPHLMFDETGKLTSIQLPLQLDETSKKSMQSYLWKINYNRHISVSKYEQVLQKIKGLREQIELELNEI